MKALKSIFIIFIGIGIVAVKCKKPEEVLPNELPPATQEGKNTFGCKIDGKVFKPFENVIIPPPNSEILKAFYSSKSIYIKARRSVERGGFAITTYMDIYIDSIDRTGRYILKNEGSGRWVQHYNFADTLYYRTDSLRTGEVIITKLDTVKKILAGTFYFQAIDYKRNHVEMVTEGRFDVKY